MRSRRGGRRVRASGMSGRRGRAPKTKEGSPPKRRGAEREREKEQEQWHPSVGVDDGADADAVDCASAARVRERERGREGALR